MTSFGHLSAADAPLHADPLVSARSIVAIGGRYLVMAFTSLGVSAGHDPPRALGWTDPWWLAGLVMGGVLAVRCAWALARRREEAAWWLGAAAAYAPVSQVFPFLFVMADRYLYFILPGLIGGVCFAARDAWQARQPGRAPIPRLPRGFTAGRIVAVATLLAIAGLAVRSHERARLWRSEVRLQIDSAAHYPDSMSAYLLRAHQAALRGDHELTVRELRGAVDRGYDRFMDLEDLGFLAPVRGTPVFQELIRDVAGSWIERSLSAPNPTQGDLLMLARAYAARGENVEALATLERGLRMGGPFDSQLRSRRARIRQRTGPQGAPVKRNPSRTSKIR